jgi:hypothetical protein
MPGLSRQRFAAVGVYFNPGANRPESLHERPVGNSMLVNNITALLIIVPAIASIAATASVAAFGKAACPMG